MEVVALGCELDRPVEGLQVGAGDQLVQPSVLASYDGAAELDRGLDLLFFGLTATLTPPAGAPTYPTEEIRDGIG